MTAGPAIDVTVVHPSARTGGRWIDDFVGDGRFRFRREDPSPSTPSLARRWIGRIGQAGRAVRGRPDVIVAGFPHLALATAGWAAALGSRTKVVAWHYNVPPMRRAAMRRGIGLLSRRLALAVVHSRIEREVYHDLYGIPLDRLVFMPMQCGRLQMSRARPPVEGRYLVAMGSMQRDYATLFEAARGLDVTVLVIADDRAVAGLDRPDNVVVRNGVPWADCLAFAAGAEAMVLPISPDNTASGHITLVTGFYLGLPVIATRSDGLADYLEDGETGRLVPPSDVPALRAAMRAMLDDEPGRKAMAGRVRARWERRYSDEAAGRNLGAVLDYVTAGDASAPHPVPEGYEPAPAPARQGTGATCPNQGAS